MLHGRVVRPPAHGASVVSIDESSVARMSRPRQSGARCTISWASSASARNRRIAAAQALKVTWSQLGRACPT